MINLPRPSCFSPLVDNSGFLLSSDLADISYFAVSCELVGLTASLLGAGVVVLGVALLTASFLVRLVELELDTVDLSTDFGITFFFEVGVALAGDLVKKLFIVRCVDGFPALELRVSVGGNLIGVVT